MNEELTRVPPHSVELEQMVLGGLMMKPDTYGLVDGLLSGESFYLEQHRAIFRAIKSLIADGKPADYPTVLTELRDTNMLEYAGGAGYVTRMVSQLPSAAHVEAHAKVVAEKHTERELMAICGEFAHDIGTGRYTHDELIGELERRLLGAMRRTHTIEYEQIKDVLNRVWQDAQFANKFHRETGEGFTSGLPTGFIDVDAIIDGLQPESFNTLAAYTGIGKTTMMLNIAANVARNDGSVLIFSLEMSNKQIASRILAIDSGMRLYNLKSGTMETGEMNEVAEVVKRISKWPILLDDTSAVRPRQISSTVRRALMRGIDISLVCVDYIQLLSPNSSVGNREQEISSITRDLKMLAQETKVPILGVSQLNRASARDNRKPQLHDLRDSGAIEQNSDSVIFLWHDGSDDKPNITIECRVAKNRHGRTGKATLLFMRETARIKDYLEMETPTA